MCLVRYLYPVDHNPRIITKPDKGFARSLAFKDINFPVKIRGIPKLEKNNYIALSIFLLGTQGKISNPCIKKML